MPVRFLSDAELARLSGWPDEIADADLITYFTLTSDDLGWLTSNVRVENRLGAALQLCTLPLLGWIPDDLTACPLIAVDRVAMRLGLAGDDVPGMLAAYGGWEGRTRRDHRDLCSLGSVGEHRPAGDGKQLDAFLLARALEHDAPGVLLQLACDWLRNERIVRPSVDTLSRRVAAARTTCNECSPTSRSPTTNGPLSTGVHCDDREQRRGRGNADLPWCGPRHHCSFRRAQPG